MVDWSSSVADLLAHKAVKTQVSHAANTNTPAESTQPEQLTQEEEADTG